MSVGMDGLSVIQRVAHLKPGAKDSREHAGARRPQRLMGIGGPTRGQQNVSRVRMGILNPYWPGGRRHP
jgi:hypothetical protein